MEFSLPLMTFQKGIGCQPSPVGAWFLCSSNYCHKSLFGVSYFLLFGFVFWWSYHFFGMFGYVWICLDMFGYNTPMFSGAFLKPRMFWGYLRRRILLCPEGVELRSETAWSHGSMVMEYPITGWFISWKVPLKLGWWLKVALFQKTTV